MAVELDTLKASIAELKDLLRSLSPEEEPFRRRAPKKCWTCGQTGHISRFCNRQTVAERRCWSCGDVGHVYRDCDRRKLRYSTKRCWSCGDQGHVYRQCSSRMQTYPTVRNNLEAIDVHRTTKNADGMMRRKDEWKNDDTRI